SWRGFSGQTYPIAQLNEPPRPNATALFTPAWGGSTPKVTGVAVMLRPFPSALPFRDLVGTVVSVVGNASVPVPRDGAVLVGRGKAASELQSSALDGSDVTIRLSLLTPNWGSVTDAVSGGPTLVRNGQPVRNAGEALTAVQLNGRDPRTAIGQRADGGIVIVAADGRGVAERESLNHQLVRPSTLDAKLLGPGGTIREVDTGSRAPGRFRFTWNGTDASGAPAPEGRYHWNVTATDDLGRSSTVDR